ncbi:DUF2270 domain-containing protein [Neorhizobium galegae]|uniref:DUF2270 domain-containing protein n=1 Tax=Neorhizobium galegae TaxID=399 RepID=UPI000621EE3B|nr:DUF2270 domain-containing protein [Neorhizobium galegae]CDZ29311.1 Uncharacterized conserved protein UCP01500 [Neorhizobium galegae bv. officinalis]KAA9387101.1 DUF2270 domain-containing protein [Neorhizobium galegae]KAB1116214.1 DUF2270 domain-containing protein [Neorhizobium galegae]MCM2501693.1 DUF2270 domain-containing protein [Neorhizobium galegae]MCQ1771439.1 DUF2270 domain-containing protein [Neorhizobium galegae]
MPADQAQSPLEQNVERRAPSLPMTSAEKANVIIHYYRGELGRMTSWRDRIDRTSNWSITVVAALLSVSLSTPTSHHGVVLFAMLLISLLLLIEARRYRFFDVYRARVRKLERHYFAQALYPQADLKPDWAQAIATSLRNPCFLISYREALFRRVRRNYVWMYAILLMAWLLKISTPKLLPNDTKADVVFSWSEAVNNAALGPLPGWSVLALVALLYAAVIFSALHREPDDGEFAHGEVHV